MFTLMRSVFFFFFLFFWTQANGQTFSGKVIDGETGQPLAYASLGVKGKSIGGITSEKGEFALSLAPIKSGDLILFHYIGYTPYAVLSDSIASGKEYVIKLIPKVYELEPVVIAQQMVTSILGNTKVGRKYTGWGDFQSLKGRSRGLLIDASECPVKVKSFAFRINHNDWDSVKFRINFFEADENGAGETVLKDNIFVVTSLKHKWVKVNLENENVIICNKVIASIEWVDAWGKVKEFSNLLTISKTKKAGYAYSQEPGELFGQLKYAEDTPAIYVETYGSSPPK
jgi:hypothetical protein